MCPSQDLKEEDQGFRQEDRFCMAFVVSFRNRALMDKKRFFAWGKRAGKRAKARAMFHGGQRRLLSARDVVNLIVQLGRDARPSNFLPTEVQRKIS